LYGKKKKKIKNKINIFYNNIKKLVVVLMIVVKIKKKRGVKKI
jgi:hypothetical protein